MSVDCLKCGDPIDIGHYKDDDEKEDDLDTFHDGEVHLTLTARRGFRESGGFGRLHAECFEEAFGVEFEPPGWAEGNAQ